MVEQYIETISGDKSILATIKYLIDARVMGKMEIPGTEHHWATMVLEMKKMKGSSFLSIDKAEGAESVLANYPNQEVFLEFMDRGGVPCRFKTQIVECRPKDILSELPKEIYRIQKRQYLRISPLSATEITFRASASDQEKGEVKDVSGGGVAFFIEKDLNLETGNLLRDLSLKIPEGNGRLSFQIPQAVIKRVVLPSFSEKRTLCAIEFSEMLIETRDRLTAYISEQQEAVIHKLEQ